MKNFIYIIFILLTISCNDILFNSGDTITKEIEIEYFKEVYIEDIFDVFLIQDTICSIKVKGGSNLISNLEFNVDSDRKLTVSDNSSASWSRSYDKIEFYITVDTLDFLRLNAPCKVISQNYLTTPNFKIWSITDYAEFDILLDGTNFSFTNNATSGGSINLSGEVNNLSFRTRGSFKLNAGNLVARNVSLTNESMANCYVYATESLSVKIYREGNVYYKGNPSIEYLNERAKEQLFKID